MKIPLLVRTYSEGLKPFISLHIKAPQQRGGRGIVNAFVDTGSPYTLISKTDADRLNIHPSGEPRMIYLGGAPIYSCPKRGVIIKVVCEDNKTIYDLSMPIIGITAPIPNNKQSINVVKSIPSIIGVDLLEHNKLALYFDIFNQISYLEKVEKK